MVYSIKSLTGLLLLIAVQFTFAQTNKEKAALEAKQALFFEDQGKSAQAIPLLEEAQRLDSGIITYSYELAVIYYNNKDYTKAKNILEPLVDRKDDFGLVYQLLGNVYDDLGNADLAIATYEKGLKQFPNTAEIYLELGITQLKKKEYNKALEYFEKGIEVNPMYPSNYYRAAKVFCSSSEAVWGMIYGEIFLNLERNTERTSEISKLLYNTYRKDIRLSQDSGFSVKFSTTVSLFPDKNKLPFAKGFYEPTIMLSLLNEKAIDINSLSRMRKKFVDLYIQTGNYQKYPNALFDYQYKVLKAGHIESYNRWVLAEGDKGAIDEWMKTNKVNWDKFIKWFEKNQIQLDDKYKFYRGQYQRAPTPVQN